MRQAVRKPASTTIRLMRVLLMIFPRIPSHSLNAQMRGRFRGSSRQRSPGGLRAAEASLQRRNRNCALNPYSILCAESLWRPFK